MTLNAVIPDRINEKKNGFLTNIVFIVGPIWFSPLMISWLHFFPTKQFTVFRTLKLFHKGISCSSETSIHLFYKF